MGEVVAMAGAEYAGQENTQAVGAEGLPWGEQPLLPEPVVWPRLRIVPGSGVLPPEATRVQDLPEEGEAQRDFAAGLGAIAVGSVIKRHSETVELPTSIIDRVEQARHGNREALDADALLALVEAILEVGVNEMELEVDEHGNFTQHGHKLQDILENTLRLRPGDHPTLHGTTRTEALSLSTMKLLEQSGKFDQGYVWVMPRMVPIGVPARALRDYGYFENLAVSWGVVWKNPASGRIVVRTLFTAGVNTENGEEKGERVMTDAELDAMIENRLSRRHDIDAAAKLYEKLGMPVPDSVAGFQRGFIMHKSQFAHEGEYDVDIAQWNDEQLGPEFFLGRHAPRQGYVEHSRKSIAAMRNLEGKKDAVVAEMLAGVTPGMSEMEVARRMARIARTHAIDYVIDHPEIEAGALGQAAANLRNEYHYYAAMGDFFRANQIRETIHEVARVNMCGFGGSDQNDALRKDGSESNLGREGEAAKNKKDEAGDSKNGIIRCRKCDRYVPKKDVVKKDCWQCPRCQYAVDICTGEVINAGESEAAPERPLEQPRTGVDLFKSQVTMRETSERQAA